MKMYQLKYLFCFVKLSPSSPFMLNQAQNSKYNTTKEFKLWQSLHTKQIEQFIVILFLKLGKIIITTFLAPTGAVGVQIWDLRVSVHFMH